MYKLCKYCNKRFENKFEEGKCYICNNKIEEFLENAKRFFEDRKFSEKYFSISIEIDKKVLAKEEDVFDIYLGKSIKTTLSELIKDILKERGMRYSSLNADIKVVASFPKNSIRIEYENLFIYGAYSKLKPFISQKRWKKYKESVEKIVGEFLKEKTKSSDYVLHCSGREDVDAINTGYRPFVLELKKAEIRKIRQEWENEFNKGEEVKIKLYGRVGRSFVTLVSDSHFDKEYRAYINTENEEDIKEVDGLKNLLILQKTPIRVLGRRKDKYRKRKIYEIRTGKDDRGVYVDIKCEAGLYIKEFISGDKGRTKPSLSSITGKNLVCQFLIVKNINYSFLNYVFKHAGD